MGRVRKELGKGGKKGTTNERGSKKRPRTRGLARDPHVAELAVLAELWGEGGREGRARLGVSRHDDGGMGRARWVCE